jgi:hypothetical protein
MSEAQKSQNNEASLVYIAGLITAGLTLGFGIRSLYWSFGMPGNELNLALDAVGANGLDNLQLLPAANYSIGLIVLGATVMVALNHAAWRYTDGY